MRVADLTRKYEIDKDIGYKAAAIVRRTMNTCLKDLPEEALVEVCKGQLRERIAQKHRMIKQNDNRLKRQKEICKAMEKALDNLENRRMKT